MDDLQTLLSLMDTLQRIQDALEHDKMQLASSIAQDLNNFITIQDMPRHLNILLPALTHDNAPMALYYIQRIMINFYKPMATNLLAALQPM